MLVRNGLLLVFVVTFVRGARLGNDGLDVGDVLQIASCIGLLVLLDARRWKDRIEAVEAYLNQMSRSPQKETHCNTRLTNPDEMAECRGLLREHLEAIVGERHPKTSPEHHAHVRDYIVQQLKANGWNVRLQPVKGPHGLGYNVIADQGDHCVEGEAGLYIVGAHYDSVSGTPGANDNGIAVAGVLALARLLQKRRPKSRIRLVAWDLEERQGIIPRAFRGSEEMVRQSKRAGESIAGVICFEMIGCCCTSPGSQRVPVGFRWCVPTAFRQLAARGFRGDFIAAAANPAGVQLARQFGAAAENWCLPTIPLVNRGLLRLSGGLRRSDHVPFWDAGIPAVMLTDTANLRAPFYHTPMDRLELIDFQFAASVVLATADGFNITG